MSKRTQNKAGTPKRALTFIDFWVSASNEIGDHRLAINASAKRLEELFIPTVVHAEHLKELVTHSLEQRSGKLTQIINVNALLDALGETAFKLRKTAADDLFDIELLEEIAWHISEHYPHLIEMPLPTELKPTQNNEAKPSVVSLTKYKIVKANRHNL